MSWEKSSYTAAGAALLSESLSGGALVITRAVSGTGVQIGKHGIPHMELCALAGNGIALSPDVQAQGVGAHQRPGVQLGAAPCKCLPCATQSKGEKQAKAEQSHLGACKHSG